MFPETFEALVRAQITLPAEIPLAPDALLADLGLDSMATVTLLIDLEEAYDTVFPDEMLVPATFATALSLWTAVVGLTAVTSMDVSGA